MFFGRGPDDKGIGAGGNHVEEDGLARGGSAGDFEFQPAAEAGVMDLRMALPEVGGESALDVEVIEMKFDAGLATAEVAPRVGFADEEAGLIVPVFVRFDQHKSHLPVVVGSARACEDTKSDVRKNQGERFYGFNGGPPTNRRTGYSAYRAGGAIAGTCRAYQEGKVTG